MEQECEYHIIEHMHRQTNVMQTLWMMYHNGVLTDALLLGYDKSNDDQIKCHISVLAAASPVLKSELINANVRPPVEINLQRYRTSVLKLYADFAYSGKIHVNSDDVQDLYNLSCQLEDSCLENCLLAQVKSLIQVDPSLGSLCGVTVLTVSDNQYCAEPDKDVAYVIKKEPMNYNEPFLNPPSPQYMSYTEDSERKHDFGRNYRDDSDEDYTPFGDTDEFSSPPVKRKRGRPPKTPRTKKIKPKVTKERKGPKRHRETMPRLKTDQVLKGKKITKITDSPLDKDAWYLSNKSAHCCVPECQKIMCEHRRVKITPEELQYSIDHEESTVELLGECPKGSYPHSEDNEIQTFSLKTGNQVIMWTGSSEIRRKLFPCGFCSSYCLGFFAYKRHLGSHFVLKRVDSVRCAMCPTICKDTTDLRRHTFLCHQSEGKDVSECKDSIATTFCPTCNEVFEADELLEHIEIEHSETCDMDEFMDDEGRGRKLRKCALCKDKVLCSHRVHPLTPEELEHCLDVEGASIQEEEFVFDVTNLNTEQKKTAEQYADILKVPSKVIKDPKLAYLKKVYRCPHCPQYIIGFCLLLVHLPTHGVQLPPLTCPICTNPMKNSRTLKRHDRKVHNEQVKQGQPGGTHKCSQCAVAYLTEGSLQIHVENHNNNLQEIKDITENKYSYSKQLDPVTNRFAKVYVCNVCGLSFASGKRKRFESHVAKHEKRVRCFRCPQCPLQFSTRADLQKHITSYHAKVTDTVTETSHMSVLSPEEATDETHGQNQDKEPKPEEKAVEAESPEYFWKCDKCLKVMCGHRMLKLTPAELKYCMEFEGVLIQDVKPVEFDFNHPNMSENQKVTAQLHKDILTAQHSYLVNAEGGFRKSMFKCPHCDYLLLSFNTFLRHLPAHNVKFPEWKCPLCPKSCMSFVLLMRHDKSMHKLEVKLGQAGGTFQCEDCNVCYLTELALERHKSNHNIDLQEIKTMQDVKYKYTKKYIAKTKRYVKHFHCDICGIDVIKKQGSFERHLSAHGLRPFECDVCDAKYGSEANLISHKREHSGERPYVCSECGDTFAKHSSLKNHAKNVHSKSNFTCDLCHKEYKAVTSLKAHIERVHAAYTLPEGETSEYQCTQCGKFVPSEWILRAHMRNHQNDGYPLKCRQCDARFKYHSGRLKHEKIQHGMQAKVNNPNIAVNKRTYGRGNASSEPSGSNSRKRGHDVSLSAPSVPLATGMLEPAQLPPPSGQELFVTVQNLPLNEQGYSYVVSDSGFEY